MCCLWPAAPALKHESIYADTSACTHFHAGFVGRLLNEQGQPTRLSTEEALLLQSLQRLDEHMLARRGLPSATSAGVCLLPLERKCARSCVCVRATCAGK